MAYANGESETWLGQFVHDSKSRDEVVIATKFSFNAQAGNPNAGGNRRKNILRALEGSLRRLQTDYVDLYILHAWDRVTPVEEVMRTLTDLVHEGKVRHIGFSDVPAWYAPRAQTPGGGLPLRAAVTLAARVLTRFAQPRARAHAARPRARDLALALEPARERLDHFFEPTMQSMVHGGVQVRRGVPWR